MEKVHRTVLIMVSAAAILVMVSLPCAAAEDYEGTFRPEKGPGYLYSRGELTEQRIQRIMDSLAETDPKKAKELGQLREKDPEKFKGELRKVMRERFRRRFRERSEYDPCIGPQLGPNRAFKKRGMFGRDGGRPKIRPMRRGTRERHLEHLKWLQENYPETAEKLAEVKEKSPELYRRRMRYSLKKYGAIAEAEEENPQLAKVLKSSLELKEKRNELLGKIRDATDEGKKKQLTGELEQVIGRRFELLVERKQIGYEQMRKRLEKLEKRVKQNEAEIEKWKSAEFKNEMVSKRLNELMSGSESFKWD